MGGGRRAVCCRDHVDRLDDPVAAILVSVVIAWSAFALFKSAVHLSLDGVPDVVDRVAVETWLRALPGVVDLHDLHIWALSTTNNALTVHLIMPGECPSTRFLIEPLRTSRRASGSPTRRYRSNAAWKRNAGWRTLLDLERRERLSKPHEG